MSQGPWSRYLKVYDPLKAGSIDGTDTRPHDKAIERAMESVYVPNKDLKSDPVKTLFVTRLNPETTEETLRSSFAKYGEIKSLKLVRDIVTGFSKQYAFVEFDLHGDAEEACQELHGSYLDNHNIFVDWECGRVLPNWIPRRLGGGFGGRKESGQLRFGGKDRPFKRPFIFDKEDKRPWKDQQGFDRSEEKQERGDERRNWKRETDSPHQRDRDRRDREQGDRTWNDRERRTGHGRDRGRRRDEHRDRSPDRESDRYRGRDRDRYDRERSYRREEEDRYRERRRRDRWEQEENLEGRRRQVSRERGEAIEGSVTRHFTESDGNRKEEEREGGSASREWKMRHFTEEKTETRDSSEVRLGKDEKPWKKRKFTEAKEET